MKQLLRTAFHALPLSLAAGAAPEDSNSPVGAWQTIDDKTGKTRSILQVYEPGGELLARVEQDLTSQTREREQ